MGFRIQNVIALNKNREAMPLYWFHLTHQLMSLRLNTVMLA